MPEKDEVFNVYTLYGNLHRCSPFVCTRESPAFIYADDMEEPVHEFALGKAQFVFKGVKNDRQGTNNNKGKTAEIL